MKMSTKGRYGTRLMLDLAIHSSNKPILLKDLANRIGISEKYLWQLISPLKNAGLIKSFRGSQGGYDLAKPPKDITLKDIVCTLEGPLTITDCVDNASNCEKSIQCITRDIWKELSNNILNTLDSITLEEIRDRYNQKMSAVSFSI